MKTSTVPHHGLLRRPGLHRWILPVLLPLLLFLSLGAWAVATPVGSAPDEPFHLASIWCGLGDRAGLCESAPNLPAHGSAPAQKQKAVPAAIKDVSCYMTVQNKSANCRTLSDTSLSPTTKVNAIGVYPPIYYAVTGIFASTNIAVSTILIRLFNVALFTAMASALFFLLPRARRPALILTLMGGLVPLGVFLVASVNPSSWAVVGCVGAWFAGLGFFETWGSRRIKLGVLAVLCCVFAVGSRIDSGVYAVLAIGAAWFVTRHAGQKRHILRLGVPIAAAVVVAALFVFVFAGQSSKLLGGILPGSGKGVDTGGLFFHNLLYLPQLWLGDFGVSTLGSLGWFDIPMTYLTQLGSLAAFFGLLAWGLRDTSWRRILIICLWLAALIAVPLFVLQYWSQTVGNLLQPRYLYPLMLLLLAATVTVRRGLRRITVMQFVALGAAVSLAESAALYAAIRRFSIANPKSLTIDLGDHPVWWWHGAAIGPMTLWVLGSLLFTAAVAAALIQIHLIWGDSQETALAGTVRPQREVAALPPGTGATETVWFEPHQAHHGVTDGGRHRLHPVHPDEVIPVPDEDAASAASIGSASEQANSSDQIEEVDKVAQLDEVEELASIESEDTASAEVEASNNETIAVVEETPAAKEVDGSAADEEAANQEAAVEEATVAEDAIVADKELVVEDASQADAADPGMTEDDTATEPAESVAVEENATVEEAAAANADAATTTPQTEADDDTAATDSTAVTDEVGAAPPQLPGDALSASVPAASDADDDAE